MKRRPSPAVTILSSICLGFLLGIIFAMVMHNLNPDLLGFEKSVLEIKLGLISAALFGLGASFIEFLLWDGENPKYTIQVVNEEE